MNARFVKTLLLAVVIVGGIWILSNRDKIRNPQDVAQLIKEKFNAIDFGSFAESALPNWDAEPVNSNPNVQVSAKRTSEWIANVIRVGSFKLKPEVTNDRSDASLDQIADICRRYDAVVLQEIDATDNAWLARLTDVMNLKGAVGTSWAAKNEPNATQYRFVSDGAHNQGQPTQSAIVFNRRTLELDQSQWYTVNDPDDILANEPLVAWFRTVGPAPDQAFTFSLVNVQIRTKRPDLEQAYLSELFRAIRNDGRGEDDVLVVGDFNRGKQQSPPLQKRDGMTWVVSNSSDVLLNALTNPLSGKLVNSRQSNSSQSDSLIFNDATTVEFTGRGGAFDFLRHYNLRAEDARRLSDYMPVWAEFSAVEGATSRPQQLYSGTKPGRVAGDLGSDRK
ncbi:MAG: deoxyribonuclease-1-like protein [Mariniblastus sp.]|jgi:deoxyribonuclease-1-like protein